MLISDDSKQHYTDLFHHYTWMTTSCCIVVTYRFLLLQRNQMLNCSIKDNRNIAACKENIFYSCYSQSLDRDSPRAIYIPFYFFKLRKPRNNKIKIIK